MEFQENPYNRINKNIPDANDALKNKGVVEKYPALVKGQEKLADIVENLTALINKNPDLAKKYGMNEIKDNTILLYDQLNNSFKENIDEGLKFQHVYGQPLIIILGMFKAITDNPEKITEKEKVYEIPLKKEIVRFKNHLSQQFPKTIH